MHPARAAAGVERNVLEWRFDPRSDARLPEASYDARILVLCQEGYTSSLAADSLRSLGLDATDVVGGFKAWREAHLPVACRDADLTPLPVDRERARRRSSVRAA